MSENIKVFAKNMRKNGSKSERMLWKYVFKDNKFHWTKQKIIGNYIVDFYCEQLKLVFEADGESHDTDKKVNYDYMRDYFINKYGIKIIRLRNEDIQMRIYTVKEYAERIINDRYNELNKKNN